MYEGYDFNMLHRFRSNEEVIKEKNKILIPVFNSIKLKIKEYKTDKQKEIAYLHQIALDRIASLKNVGDNESSRLVEQEQEGH